eukprot:evm.model.NODE_38104_length_17421_cov_32.336834.6
MVIAPSLLNVLFSQSLSLPVPQQAETLLHNCEDVLGRGRGVLRTYHAAAMTEFIAKELSLCFCHRLRLERRHRGCCLLGGRALAASAVLAEAAAAVAAAATVVVVVACRAVVALMLSFGFLGVGRSAFLATVWFVLTAVEAAEEGCLVACTVGVAPRCRDPAS